MRAGRQNFDSGKFRLGMGGSDEGGGSIVGWDLAAGGVWMQLQVLSSCDLHRHEGLKLDMVRDDGSGRGDGSKPWVGVIVWFVDSFVHSIHA